MPVKNILNWTPNKGNPFIIARANDFDKMCNMIPTEMCRQDNPYALTFDPSYVYGPNQGARSFWIKIYVEVVFITIISHKFSRLIQIVVFLTT
jgi:hypothetical protein